MQKMAKTENFIRDVQNMILGQQKLINMYLRVSSTRTARPGSSSLKAS